MEVVSGLLGGGESARLAKKMVRGTHIASSADVYYNLYTRYQTQFIFFGTPTSSRSINDLKKSFLIEIDQLKRIPVSEMELNRVKNQIIAEKTFEKDSIFGQAMQLGLLEILGLPANTADEYTNNIQKVTPQQIQEVATHYFLENAMTEAQLFPSAEPKQ